MHRSAWRLAPIGLILCALLVMTLGTGCFRTTPGGDQGGGSSLDVDNGSNVENGDNVAPQPTISANLVTEGTLDLVDTGAGELTMTLVGGGAITVKVDQSTLVLIDGETGALADLQPGAPVSVEVDQDTGIALSITAYGGDTGEGAAGI